MAMLSVDNQSVLVSFIYDAALDQGRWPCVTERLRSALDGDDAILAMTSGQGGAARYEAAAADLERPRVCIAGYQATGPTFRAVEAGTAGRTSPDEDVLTEAEPCRTGPYADWRRAGGKHHVLQAVPMRSGHLTTFFAVARSPGRPAFAQADVALFRSLLPHVGRATSLNARLGAALAARDGAMRALDRLAHGAYLMDAGGRVIELNQAARALLNPRTGLSLRAGALHAASAAQTRALHRLIERVCEGEGPRGRGGWMLVDRPDAASALRVLVTNAGDAREWHGSGGVAALALVDAGADRPDLLSQNLSELFGLTRAESKVALLTTRGGGGPAVAATLGIAHDTVRAHLRRVFDKTGARGQVELGVMIARLPARPIEEEEAGAVARGSGI